MTMNNPEIKSTDTKEKKPNFYSKEGNRKLLLAYLDKPFSSLESILGMLDLVLVPDEVPVGIKLISRVPHLFAKAAAICFGNQEIIKPLTKDELDLLWVLNNKMRRPLFEHTTQVEQQKIIAEATPLTKRALFYL